MVNPIQLGDFITDIGLMVALGLFVLILFRSRVQGNRLKSFKFWVSMAVVLWVIPEAIAQRGPFPIIFGTEPPQLGRAELIRLETSPGPWIHTSSMALLVVLVVWKLRFLLGLRQPKKVSTYLAPSG